MQISGSFFHIVYLFLHGCGLHYDILSESERVMHYPGRNTVYLQIFEFIGVVSEFHFFMKIKEKIM